MVVYTDLMLNSIQNFDVKTGTLKTSIALNLVWKDDFIQWEAYDKDMMAFQLPRHQVWTPTMILHNPAEGFELTTESNSVEKTRHFYNGTVNYIITGSIFTVCKPYIFHYPMDKHSCDIQILNSHYQENVVLKSLRDSVRLDHYMEHPEWLITGTNVSTQLVHGSITEISFIIHFSRKPEFHLINVVLPITFLSALNVLVFVLPHQSGERISYAITLLLTFVVFMNAMADELPPIGDPVCLLNIYITIQMTMSSLIVFFTIASLSLYNNDDKRKPVPAKWKVFAYYAGHLLCLKFESDHDYDIQDIPKLNEVYPFEDDSDSIKESPPHPYESLLWKDVGHATDKCMFVISCLILICDTSVYFVCIFLHIW
ncbi:5-hydroxytryptamine receptor 3A-like [Crassostrea virginica]